MVAAVKRDYYEVLGVPRDADEEERRSSMAKSSAMRSTKPMNDSSEIATTHVLRALAYPIATWCTPHDGSHQNRREFSRFPVSGRCKVLQSGASIPASFPSSAVRPPRQARYL